MKRLQTCFLCAMMFVIGFIPAMSIYGMENDVAALNLEINKGLKQSSMPSTGDVKTLVVAVEFADAPFEDNIVEKLQENFFGPEDENDSAYPLESLAAYYNRSSFGKLKLSGDVITYTSEHDRAYYNGDMNQLIEEVVDAIKKEAGTQLDAYLSQYDSNGDKILDGIYIYYTGGTDGWNEQWWSYVGYWNGYSIGAYTFGSTCILGDYRVHVLTHETGHMLGLGDYYDYATLNINMGITSIDMMQGNIGDHNIFSKLLLGWVDPSKLIIIKDGEQSVQLEECTKEGNAVLIIPDYDENGLYTEFYLIEYRGFFGNDDIQQKVDPQKKYELESGLCIYYVNAKLNDEGTGFLYDDSNAISSGTPPLIRQVHANCPSGHTELSGTLMDGSIVPWPEGKETGLVSFECYYGNGDEFTPYTVPSSSFYGDSGREYTGITVNDIVLENDTATFKVSFEQEPKEYSVTYEAILPMETIENLRADVYFSTDISMPSGSNTTYYVTKDSGAYMMDEDGQVLGDLQLNLVKGIDGLLYINEKTVKDKLQYDKTYYIVIPGGTLYDALGNDLGEIRIEYYTYKMPEQKLAAPVNVRLEGTTLKWDEVQNADSYVVKVFLNNSEKKTYSADDSTYLDLSSLFEEYDYGTYRFVITAYPQNPHEYLCSDAASLEYTIEAAPVKNGVALGEDGNWYFYTNGVIDTAFTGMASNEYGWWYFRNGQIAFDYTGMARDINGWKYVLNGTVIPDYTGMAYDGYGWCYFRNGQIDSSYTGMASNEYGWWYFRNGQLDFGYTGMASNEYGWWYYRNGQIAFDYTGMACDENGWKYVVNGAVITDYTGMACNEYGWWYFRNGQIDFGYTGMACNENGWWYYRDGQIDFGYTGMACNENGWWYYRDGQIDFGYTGMACNEYGWWYYRDGQIDFGYTGMACNENGWWYYRDGQIDFGYTGMACNENGWWYYRDGQIDFGYTGMACNENGWWYFRDGQIDFGYTGMACNENGWWYYRDGQIDFGYTGYASNEYGVWHFTNGVIDL